MADGLIRFLSTLGEPIAAPDEWTPAFVEINIRSIDGWQGVSLRTNGVEQHVSLRRLSGAIRIVAEWPRSGPGRYRLQVATGTEYDQVAVEIRPRKLTTDQFGGLIEQLETRLPLSIALGVQRLGGLAGVTLVSPQQSTLTSEVHRLRIAILGDEETPGLAAILPAIGQEPHQVLRASGLWVRREHARRPDPNRLLQSFVRPGNVTTERQPIDVYDSRVEHSFDVYENRLVRTFATQVDRRLRRLLRATGGGNRAELHDELLTLARRLGRAMRTAHFLNQVRDLSSPPDRVSMVLLRRPHYRSALQSFLRFQRGQSVRIDNPALEAPLNELPDLYQLWCSLHVIDALLRVGLELGFVIATERLIGRDAAGIYVRPLPDGKPAVVLNHPETGTRVELIPERTYGPGSGSLRSLSFTQRPDIAIEVTSTSGETSIWLFDPKYKLAGEINGADFSKTLPLKADIDKMHTYRDAIRKSDGGRVVRYAAILYPGTSQEFSDGIGAIGCVPLPGDGWSGTQAESVLRSALSRSELRLDTL
jgi:hypothetical protein